MSPWEALAWGLLCSLAWRLHGASARAAGRKLERDEWVGWLRSAWEQARFSIDMAAHVRGFRSTADVSAGLNDVLAQFEGWPGQSAGDGVTTVNTRAEGADEG